MRRALEEFADAAVEVLKREQERWRKAHVELIAAIERDVGIALSEGRAKFLELSATMQQGYFDAVEAVRSISPVPGPPGPPGRDGRDGNDGRQGLDGAQGRDGAPGRDGFNGANGTNGQDGAPGINGRDGAAGPAGADGLNGFNLTDFNIRYDDERTLIFCFDDGRHKAELPIVFPWPLYRGVFKDGEHYTRGDCATFNGSLFVAMIDTDARPESSKDWRLAVKCGRNGKDGKDGATGIQGPKGDPGKDLTQMGPDGKKW